MCIRDSSPGTWGPRELTCTVGLGVLSCSVYGGKGLLTPGVLAGGSRALKKEGHEVAFPPGGGGMCVGGGSCVVQLTRPEGRESAVDAKEAGGGVGPAWRKP